MTSVDILMVDSSSDIINRKSSIGLSCIQFTHPRGQGARMSAVIRVKLSDAKLVFL